MATSILHDDLLSRADVAAILGVKVQTLALWASTGRHELPFVKVGRLAKYRRSDVEKWLDDRTQTSVDGNRK